MGGAGPGEGGPARLSINGTAVKVISDNGVVKNFAYQGYKIKIKDGKCEQDGDEPVCSGNASLIVEKNGNVKTVPLYMACGD